MKIMGAILIFAAASAAAAAAVRYESRKLNELDQCCTALRIIAAEVDRLSTTDTIIHRLTECGRLKSFSYALEQNCTLSFEERWINACKSAFSDIDSHELSEMCSLGGYIGRYERSQELDALMRATNLLEETAIYERQNSLQKKRTSLGLYAAAGVLLIIILL